MPEETWVPCAGLLGAFVAATLAVPADHRASRRRRGTAEVACRSSGHALVTALGIDPPSSMGERYPFEVHVADQTRFFLQTLPAVVGR